MAPGPGVCENCGTPARERVETMTGRAVCQSCADSITATTAAMLTGERGLSADAGEAVAIKGWMRRVRQWRQRGAGPEAGRPKQDGDG